ncbi:MAG: 50S ribosomal protein L33 [Cyanobacteria bacterium P01_H01_bin.74]
MAKKKGDGCVHIVMECTDSASDHQYHTIKNKKKNPDRIELRKYNPELRRHVLYRESKKSNK